MADYPFSLTSGPAAWIPSDNNLLGATADPSLYSPTQTLTAGTVYLVKLPIRSAQTITNLWWGIGTVGSGASTGSFTGLYSSSGTLLTGSADIASFLTVSQAAQIPLTTPQALTAASFVWAAILSNLATTQPALMRASLTPSVTNAGLTAASYRIATNGTAQTSLPASITPASNSLAGAAAFWTGWS